MKTMLTILALSLSAAASQLPFNETFEAPRTNGTLNGQNGWINLSGTANIQSGVVAIGSQAMEIRSGATTHSLSNSTTSVWVGFQARIAAAPSANPVVTNANTSIAFFVNTNLNLVVYSNQTPVLLSAKIQTNTWTRFDIFCDYTNLKWILSVNGTNVAQNLGLYSASQQIESVLIANDSTNSAYFDELAVQETEPANSVASIDKDSDGLPDWWEQRYFGGITNALPNQTGSNGLSNIQTYIAGLNPENPSDLLTLTQTATRKFNWNRKPERQYDVYWTSNLFSNFSFIQTATGSEFEDTNPLRTAEAAGFYQIRVHK